MVELANAHSLIPDPGTEKRKKIEEKERAHHRKSDKGKAGFVKTDKALGAAGTLTFGQWHRFVSAFHKHGTSRGASLSCLSQLMVLNPLSDQESSTHYDTS